MTYVVLFLVALVASIFGSMVGLGGGFVMLPVLRLFYGLSPALAAGTSLALVIANSASGSASYLMQRRVHLRTGWLVAAAGVPGGIVGAIAVKNVSPRAFDWLFAIFLVAVAVDVFLRRRRQRGNGVEGGRAAKPGVSLAMGFFVGFVSSLFGVGGGVILIPSLLYFTTLPVHVVGATSQFAILLTAPVGFFAHIFQRDVDWNYALPLALGGLVGGPIGARISTRVNSPALLLWVAAALIVAALALVFRHVSG